MKKLLLIAAVLLTTTAQAGIQSALTNLCVKYANDVQAIPAPVTPPVATGSSVCTVQKEVEDVNTTQIVTCNTVTVDTAGNTLATSVVITTIYKDGSMAVSTSTVTIPKQ